MCAPNEPVSICVIKEQRNNVADELAIAEIGRRTEVEKRKDEGVFWKQYVNGLVNGDELKSHIEKVCSWKGQQNEPVGELCRWWDDNYVPHPPKAKGVKK